MTKGSDTPPIHSSFVLIVIKNEYFTYFLSLVILYPEKNERCPARENSPRDRYSALPAPPVWIDTQKERKFPIMKKMLMFLSSAVLILVLTVGCCLTAYGEATASPSATEAPETSETEAGSDTLIAYFSWSGNTEQ